MVDHVNSRNPRRLDRRAALKKLALGGVAGGATWAAPNLERISLVPDYAVAATLPTCDPIQLPNIGRSAGVPDLVNPEGVDVDSFGNVWVADRPGGKIQQFSSDGVHMRTISGLGFPAGVVVDAAGAIYLVSVNRAVYGIRPTGGLFVTITNSSSPAPSPLFVRPEGIDVDPWGNIYIADPFNEHIYGFLPDGTQFLTINHATPGFGYPWKVAADGLGWLYISDVATKTIYRFSVSPPSPFSTQDTAFSANNPNFRSPAGIAVTSDGATIYMVDDILPQLIRLDSTGAQTLSVRLPNPSSGTLPMDVAVGDVPGEVRIANALRGIQHYSCV